MKKLLLLSVIFSSALVAVPVSDTATLQSTLQGAIGGGATIDLTADITLSGADLIANGNVDTAVIIPINTLADFSSAPGSTTTTIAPFGASSRTLSGGGSIPGFFLRSEIITITGVMFSSMKATGGAGVKGGGGGAGLGGAIFVDSAMTTDGMGNANGTITDCQFTNCSAIGANASTYTVGTGGGGGGLHGAASTSGGGGGFAGKGDRAGGGSGLNSSGATGGNDFDGVTRAGGNAPGGGAIERGGAGAGPVGDMIIGSNGGNGDDFGGGGGAQPLVGSANSGNGGYGAGGGGGGNVNGGDSNFGGGGGSGSASTGTGGFGGGSGIGTIGGAGAGFGGALFLKDGSTLQVNGTNVTTIFSGNSAIGGTSSTSNFGLGKGGAIFLDENATLILSGDFSFSGNTATNGDGSTGEGQDIFMVSNSILTMDLTSNLTLLNPIEGNLGVGRGGAGGGLTKTGAGLLTLNGVNTYSGTTTVTGGELRIIGSTTSDIVVSGGILSGVFSTVANPTTSVSGSLTIDAGNVYPGVNGVGTITLAGDFTHNNGTLVVDVTPDPSSDRIFLSTGTGTVSNTALLEVVMNGGNYIKGTVYTIIQGTVTGNYDQGSGQVIRTGIASSVPISVTNESILITILESRLFLDHEIKPGIPREVVDCIQMVDELIDPNSDFAMVVMALGTLNNSKLNTALTALSPVSFGILEWINLRNNSYVTRILSDHLFELCCSPRNCCSYDSNFWISALGTFSNDLKPLDNLPTCNSNSPGALIGYDYCWNPCFYTGLAFGYTRTTFDFAPYESHGDINTFYGALYGSWQGCRWSIDASILGGGSENEIDRGLKFSVIDRTAKSDFWDTFVTAHVGLQGKMNGCYLEWTPFVLADYHYFHRNSFKEKGADSINLMMRSKDQHMMRTETGLRVSFPYNGHYYCLAPYLGASWVGDFPLNTSKQKGSFEHEDCVMSVKAFDSMQSQISPEVGCKITSCKGFSILAGYKGNFNKRIRLHNAQLRFEWIF